MQIKLIRLPDKGEYISGEELRACIDIDPDPGDWWRIQLALREHIVNQYEARGVVVTVKAQGKGLRVLTDEEVTPYQYNWVGLKIESIARSLYKMLGVRTSGFSSNVKRSHDRAVNVTSRQVQSIMNTNKKLNEEYCTRNNPKKLPKLF